MPYLGTKVNNLLPLKPSFYLHFTVYGDGTEWIDQGLPTPNYFYRYTNANGIVEGVYSLGYVIDGVFNTKPSMAYLEDMIRRFIVSLPIKERLMYRPADDTQQHGIIYKLKDLQALQSLTNGNGRIVPKLHQLSARHNSGRFWETKLWIEFEIKRNGGEGSMVSFDTLLDVVWHAWQWKDYSTCRAFARNIWRWYEGREWQYHILNYRKSNKTEEEISMSRQEHMKKVHAARNAKAKAKIRSVLEDMFVQDQITKKNGALKIGAIAKLVEMSEKTTSKHLKEMGLI